MQNARRDGFIVRIRIKDDAGNVVDEIDAIAFKGLLSKAHEEGLRQTKTTLVQIPSEANRNTAIVHATVRTRRGTFTGIGDANPQNVNRRIAPHVVRMAETRALARALRVAVNVGEVSLEELGADLPAERIEAPADERRSDETRRSPDGPGDDASRGDDRRDAPPPRFRGRDTSPTNVAQGDRRAMSEEQKKLCFRLAYDLGCDRDNVRDKVLRALGVERLEWATRQHASAAIDALRAELGERRAMQGESGTTNGRSNGQGTNGHAGTNGSTHHA